MKKVKLGGKILDQKDVEENTINRLYDNMMDHKEDEDDLLPGQDREGVDSGEWGESDSD